MNVEALLGVLGIVIPILLLGGVMVGKARERPLMKRSADQILRAVLTDEQYGQLIQQRYIDIPSPSEPKRIYRVPKHSGLVQVREEENVTMWLCLRPVEWMPDDDIVVIHKLMIEADEETYLQKANQLFPIYVDNDGGALLMPGIDE